MCWKQNKIDPGDLIGQEKWCHFLWTLQTFFKFSQLYNIKFLVFYGKFTENGIATTILRPQLVKQGLKTYW